METDAKHHALAAGTPLRLRSAEGHALGDVFVVSVSDGRVWIAAKGAEIEAGDRVLMEHILDGDARYTAPARVEFVPPETLALRRTGEWSRDQRRSDVRIRVFHTTVDLEVEDLDESVPVELVDLSAGGFSGLTRGDLGRGADVRCRIELGTAPLELAAKVVRVGPGDGRRYLVGFAFTQVNEAQRSEIREWVLREGVRRRKMKGLGG